MRWPLSHQRTMVREQQAHHERRCLIILIEGEAEGTCDLSLKFQN